jgi:hypothetical protein
MRGGCFAWPGSAQAELAIGCRTPRLHSIREKVSGRLLLAHTRLEICERSRIPILKCRGSNPVAHHIQRVTYEPHLKSARYRKVSQI